MAVLVMMVAGFLLRAYVSADPQLHQWDERFHALVAKNLGDHPLTPTLYDDPILPFNYKSWNRNHIWVHKQPVPLWTMAASIKLLGNTVWGARFPSILLTTLGIGLLFYVGRYLFDPLVGFVAAFLFSINGLILELTGGRVATDHYDVFFLFFVLLSVYFSVRYIESKKNGFNFLVGLSLAAAILTKWLPALIVLPIWFLLVLDSRKFSYRQVGVSLALICGITFLFAAPWQLYTAHQWPLETAYEKSFNMRHITEVLEEQGGPWYYFIGKIRILFGELIYLPLIWFLWKTTKRPRFKYLALVVWMMVPLVFFSFVKTKMQGYILFTAPAYFIITGLFFTFLKKHKNIIGTKLVYLVMSLLLLLPVRFGIERMKPLKNNPYPIWRTTMDAYSKEFDTKKTAIFNIPRPVEAMYFYNLMAYEELPKIEVLSDLNKKGYSVYIINNENLSADYKNLDFGKIITLAKE